MDIQTTITLIIVIINLVFSLIITKIQQSRIKDLKDTIEEQKKTVELIKDFAELKNVDEFKKYVALIVKNVEMEKDAAINTIIAKVRNVANDMETKMKETIESVSRNKVNILANDIETTKGIKEGIQKNME